jgi:hypothetical protein
LWARITAFPQNTSWIAEMLVRSKCAPLTIDLHGPPNVDVLSLFPSHISHTRKLRLLDLTMDHIDSIEELCSMEAPVLEHFELLSSASFPVYVHPLNGTKLFKDHAPKLRTFSLCHAYILWSSIPRSQLTELRIILPQDQSNIDDTPLPNISQFIDVLTSSPALEVLVLQFCLPPMRSSFSERRKQKQTIHLPRLSHLDLAGSGSSIGSSLNMLKLPSLIRIRLQCIFESAVAYNGGLFLPPILAPFKKSHHIVFKSFRLSVKYKVQSLHMIISSYLPTSTDHSTFETCLEHDCLSIHRKFVIGHLSYTLEQMCVLLPIAEVEFLSISAPGVAESVNWGELFGRCEKITTIEAFGGGTTTLLPTLTPPKRKKEGLTFGGKGKKRQDESRDLQAPQLADKATAYVLPIFPNLRTLVLNKLDFSKNVPSCGKLYDVLMNTIRRRRSYNVPLKSLTIENCIITAKRAKALEKEVPRFHCDNEWRMPFHSFDGYDYYPDFFELGA